MLIYTTTALILCATLALTSSAVNETETDGFAKNNRSAFPLELARDTNRPVSTTLQPGIVNKHVNNESFPLLAEGGPILHGDGDRSTEYLSVGQSEAGKSSKSPKQSEDEENSRMKLPKTRNASVVARKGVPATSKITARKGVGPELSTTMKPTTEAVEEAAGHAKSRGKNREDRIFPFAGNSDVETANVTEKTITTERTNVSLSLNNTRVLVGEISSNATTNSTKSVDIAPTTATKSATNSTVSKSTAKNFKPKPTVTIGEMEADKPIPASPTKTPPLGMPRKIDYIIPVIITIMALPLLGGATFLLYRRGRDCWDKRHYRRMDFLIDGMYNDYSWK